MTSFTITTQTASAQFLSADDDVGTITADGALTVVPNAVTISAESTRLINDGMISSSLGSAVSVSAESVSILNNGFMSGGSDVIKMTDATGQVKSITNSGTISAQGAAHSAIEAASGGVMINNTGTISALLADAIRITTGTSPTVNFIINSGVISTSALLFEVAINLDDDADRVTNSGTILGGVDLGGGGNTLRNRGLIDGNVTSFGGDDLIDLRGGEVFGKISSGGGKDTILGSAGEDSLTGGDGADRMSGKGGADVFVFGTGDSGLTAVARDRITDFQRGLDDIDLSLIDAKPAAGNQAFKFVTGAFTKAGQVHVVQKGAERWVELNLDADAQAEMRIVLTGKGALTAGDFVL